MDEDILIQFKCAASGKEFKHILKNPIKLHCGHVVCNDCLKEPKIKCVFCNRMSLSNVNIHVNISDSLNNHLVDAFQYIEQMIQASINKFKSKLEVIFL